MMPMAWNLVRVGRLLSSSAISSSKLFSTSVVGVQFGSSKLFSTSVFRGQYKSSISLDKLYPGSSVGKVSPPKSEEMGFSGYIPIKELQITYSCSSGPGGQNVNKVATKVDLRFHLESATWLSDHVKAKMMEQHSSQLTKDGWLVVKSDRTRSQTMNQADALEKLRETIRRSLIPPPPLYSDEELEKIRKGKIKASRERLKEKRIRGNIKKDRQNNDF